MTNHKFIYSSAILACLLIAPVQAQVSDLTSSVSTVSGETLYKTPAANLTNTFYGLFSGTNVMQGQGEPGYDAASIYIRGIGAYTYGNYAVYIDGFQSNMTYAQYLTPAEIESVSILKDAAALTPFGMKGANGVIWIVTNRGVTGKPQVKLQIRTGIQQLQNITKPLQSYDYAMLYNEANSNDNSRIWTPHYTSSQLSDYKNGA
ncbi:MAG: TonB-dependent receptor plug domain-containing protein, partial [Candidatus Symbiothrix sp.]|nr:TonB-dependent receptor plug domain-containing protein [Candidatus Symbiothrix sp.]